MKLLGEKPMWVFEHPKDPSTWPGGLWLARDVVVAEWFCLARETGAVLWQRSVDEANYVASILGGTILGATMGPGRRPARGACGLDLATGKPIWSHSVEVFEAEAGGFVCTNGEVRDINTGAVVERRSKLKRRSAARHRRGRHWKLSETAWGGAPVVFDEGLLVSVQGAEGGGPFDNLYRATSRDERTRWTFSPRAAGWWVEHAEVEQGDAPRFIYFLVARERTFEVHDEGKPHIKYVPRRRFLLALDTRTGEVVQEVDLGVWRVPCVVGDADADGVGLHFDQRLVWYFAKAQRSSVD